MVRLTTSDSLPRVENAVERFCRLCTQTPGAEKYKLAIEPYFKDFVAKIATLKKVAKEVNFAQDTVSLFDKILDNLLRDLKGRAVEYDRNNRGANTLNLIFPGGNVTKVITLPNKEEPDVAQGIAKKIASLGKEHELYPFVAKIEAAVADCKEALSKEEEAIRKRDEAITEVNIAKHLLIRQYNGIYYAAANDVDKDFAEQLFPRLYSKKKKKKSDDDDIEDLD